MTTPKTTREKLAELLDLAAEDQKASIVEAASYLQGADAQAFRAKIASFHDRTIPGSSFDQIISAFMQVFDNVKDMTDKVANPPKPEVKPELGVPTPAPTAE